MTQIQFQHSLTGLQSKLYYFALSLTSNSDRAQDLVQETYLKALIYRDKFSTNTNLMAWVYTIMKNTFINDYRRNAKAKTTLESTSNKLQISFSKNDYSATILKLSRFPRMYSHPVYLVRQLHYSTFSSRLEV